MKYIINFIIFGLILIFAAGCSESFDESDPLSVVLFLNKDYKSKFIPSAQDSEKSLVSLSYFRVDNPEKAKKVIDEIEDKHKKIWAMGHGATLLKEKGEKVKSDELIAEALQLAESTQWRDEKDNDYTYQTLIEVLGKLQKYEDIKPLIKNFKKPDMALIGIDRVVRDAIEIEQYDIAKEFLDLGYRYGKQHLKSHPEITKSIHYLAWGYHEVGELDKARELLKTLAEHDMKRALGKHENVNYMFSSYEQKLLMTGQYDLALDIKKHIKNKLIGQNKSSYITQVDIDIQNGHIAAIYALKDKSDLSRSFRIIERLGEETTRIYAYKYAATKLYSKGRLEDATLMLNRAKKEVVYSAKPEDGVNEAVIIAYEFMNQKNSRESLAMLGWVDQNASTFDDRSKRISTWIRVAEISERLGEQDYSDRILTKINELMPSIEEGRTKDKYISDIAELYCARGDEESCKSGLSKMSDSSDQTSVLRKLAKLKRKEGDFTGALTYISQISHRGTVMQNLRFLAVDMHNQNAQLDQAGIALLSEIADGNYE